MVKVTDSDHPISLLRYVINYSRKFFYQAGPRFSSLGLQW